MKANVESIRITDIPNFNTFVPDDEERFGFNLELSIGSRDTKGTDNFQLFVCTPKWLEVNRNKHDIIFCRHILIVFSYDIEAIFSAIKERCNAVEGDNWQGLAIKLSRYFHWEFEDYQPYSGPI